jgi:hypothetical protein
MLVNNVLMLISLTHFNSIVMVSFGMLISTTNQLAKYSFGDFEFFKFLVNAKFNEYIIIIF